MFLKGCNHDDIIESNINDFQHLQDKIFVICKVSGILPHNRVYESFLFKNVIVIEA